MRPKRQTGWMGASTRRGAPKIEPVIPAEFDALVRSLGIPPESAPQNPAALRWIKKHYRNRYVPENVLEIAGIHFCEF